MKNVSSTVQPVAKLETNYHLATNYTKTFLLNHKILKNFTRLLFFHINSNQFNGQILFLLNIILDVKYLY